MVVGAGAAVGLLLATDGRWWWLAGECWGACGCRLLLGFGVHGGLTRELLLEGIE